jgi:hypothetical protein
MSGPEADEGVPATPETPMTIEEDDIAPETPIPFKQYLETVHPSVSKEVTDGSVPRVSPVYAKC